jgi:hypothetical protein
MSLELAPQIFAHKLPHVSRQGNEFLAHVTHAILQRTEKGVERVEMKQAYLARYLDLLESSALEEAAQHAFIAQGEMVSFGGSFGWHASRYGSADPPMDGPLCAVFTDTAAWPPGFSTR